MLQGGNAFPVKAIKVLAGEQVLQPVLQTAISELAELTEEVGEIALPDVPGAVQGLVETGGRLSILASFLVWLAQTDVIDFWIDLFGALIEDVATFDSDLSETKKVIDRVLGGDLLTGILAQLDELRTKLLDDLDRLQEEVEGGLAEAVQVITAGLSRALSALECRSRPRVPPGSLIRSKRPWPKWLRLSETSSTRSARRSSTGCAH